MDSKNENYIVYSGRTAIGKISGSLSLIPAPKLGAALVKDALKQTALDPKKVDEIIMGNVLTAGVGQAPARQAAIYGGLADNVCATTINKVCGSGLRSVVLADFILKARDAQVIFAGGQENMSLAPHLLMNSRSGYRFGGFEAKDSMQWDGLWDPYSNVSMGLCGEYCAEKYNFTREAQDEFAIQSYSRSRIAVESGIFSKEIVPFEIKTKKDSTFFDKDEEPFSVQLEKLTTLRPAFKENGTITAGNASSINDGAALVVMANEQGVKANNLKPIAKIVASASFAHEPNFFTTAPIGCIKALLKKTGFNKNDIDLFEINEAFSVVTMAAIQELALDPMKVNVHGGAVSLGHPIGASGTRILVSLINALKIQGKKRGIATLCIGGGEAIGVMIEMV